MWEKDESRLQGIHMPQRIKEESHTNINGKIVNRKYKDGRCILCRSHSSITCDICKVHLCCEEHENNENYGMNCWRAFQTQKKLEVN